MKFLQHTKTSEQHPSRVGMSKPQRFSSLLSAPAGKVCLKQSQLPGTLSIGSSLAGGMLQTSVGSKRQAPHARRVLGKGRQTPGMPMSAGCLGGGGRLACFSYLNSGQRHHYKMDFYFAHTKPPTKQRHLCIDQASSFSM